MVSTIQFYRGLKAGLPTLKAGEPGWCTDTLEFYIGNGTTNQLIGGEITALTPTQIRTLLNVGEIVDKEQIYFVGKHGNDGNDGKTNDKAFLTFGAAITAAIAETPAADNKFNIICFDAGIYAENVTVPSYVYVYAPKAELNGTHTIADNTCLHVYSIEIAAGTAVSKTVGTGSAYFNFHGLKLTGSASGFLCTAGEIEIDGSKISVENGYGVGSAITGHMHVGVNTIHVTGTGICAGIASTGELSITADCLYDEGVGGTGLYVGSTGTLNAQIANLDCATAYNIATAGATLNLMVASLAGTETNSGTANVSKAEDGHTSGADTTLGAQSGDLDMNSHQVVSLSVPDAAGEAIRQTAKITEAALETLVDGGGGGGGGDTLPIADTTAVVKGSVDATKLVRIEADGLTTGTTRVLTMPDKDITPAASGVNSDITSMTGLSDDGIPMAKVVNGHAQNADTALGAQTEALDMNTHSIGGVVDPTTDQQAATKKYVDDNSIANLSEDTTPDLGGTLGVKENQIQLDATLSATTKYSGITCDIVIGYASAAFGDLVYLSNSDDRWEKTDANAEGTSGDVMLGIVISAGSSDGDAGVVMLQGFLKLTAWDFPLGGDALYVSETAGAMTATRPTTASTIVRVVGYAGVDADTVYFNPSRVWIETAAA